LKVRKRIHNGTGRIGGAREEREKKKRRLGPGKKKKKGKNVSQRKRGEKVERTWGKKIKE